MTFSDVTKQNGHTSVKILYRKLLGEIVTAKVKYVVYK